MKGGALRYFYIISILYAAFLFPFVIFNTHDYSRQNNVVNNSSSNTAIISDTVAASPTASLEEVDLPTIKGSELPDPFDGSYDKEKHSFLYGGIVGDNGKYTKVAVEDTPIEKPISISYSNKVSLLHLKSDKEIEEIIATSGIKYDELDIQNLKENINSQISEFGQIARQYLPYEKITGYYEADIDNDGTKEKLITVCSIGANHCSDYAEIIKSNEVIFSTQFYANSRGISPAKNGFYISWTDEESFRDEDGQESGLCCELSHNKTLFQFQGGKFVPIQQWKVPHIWKRVLEEITFTGKIFTYMTYGRRLFENLDINSQYKYLIVEPEEESMTADINDGDIVKVIGVIVDNCYWNDIKNTDYKGCVPWVEIEEIKKLEK